MFLAKVQRSLRDDVVASRHTTEYQAARAREDALRDCPTVAHALLALERRGDDAYEERGAITRALVREYQRARSPFFASVLTLAFVPMLVALRCRIRTSSVSNDELGQRIVAAFVETIAAFPLGAKPTHTALRIRQRTETSVFREFKREKREEEDRTRLEELVAHTPDIGIFDEPARGAGHDAEDLDDMSALLREISGDTMATDKVDLVIATCITGEKLFRYARRTHDAASGEPRDRYYERLRKERHRALQKLRPLVSERLSPIGGSPPLFLVGART
ncbi:MAG: hypothetical protein ACHREM_11795 [Polyangiales bacterium]